jgi:hypothetical protein
VAATYEVNSRLAAEAERHGDGLAATVRWCLAAEAAPDALRRVAALAAARRNAELAFHQGVWAAATAGRTAREARGVPWRALAEAAGLPFQTLYRRYRARPAKLPARAR